MNSNTLEKDQNNESSLIPSIFDKEAFAFILLFSCTVFFVYLTPVHISTVYLVIILIAFYKSDKDYFWLALAFIFESNPGGLFLRSDLDHNLTLIPGGDEGNIFLWMMFLVLGLIKSYRVSPGYGLFFKNGLILLTFYLVFLVVSFGIGKYTVFFRSILPWTLLLIIPRLLPDMNSMSKFFKLIFIGAILVLVGQLYEIIAMEPLARSLGGSTLTMKNNIAVFNAVSAIRPTYGIQVSFLSFLASVFYLSVHNKKIWSRKILYLIMILSAFSLYISATRGWMIATSFVFISYLVVAAPRTAKFYGKLTLFALAIFFSFMLIVPFNNVIENAWLRYTTLSSFAEGDFSAKGTSIRFEVRGPRVLKKFEESPVIGWGYGTEALEYSDGHVGNHNLLMHTGIIGFALFLGFLTLYSWKLFQNFLWIRDDNSYKKAHLLFIVFIIGLIIIHITRQIFDFILPFDTGVLLISLLTLSALVYKDSREAGVVPETLSSQVSSLNLSYESK